FCLSRGLGDVYKRQDETYPALPHIMDDVIAGQGYVLEECGKVMAYGAVVYTGEPAYDDLDGEWLSDGAYVVVHRLAVLQESQGSGVATLFFNMVENMAAEKGIGSFRIDTNFDNFPMLHLMEKCGFEYCGEVRYERGSRRAFEKLI
ncbi:MAG: GNAT family N-acetyltransferase, partial [Muribaculaceae bacterium]|nr:GNAT family N-acetyltransferase [Muribaculaceae bacterium]